MPIPNRFQTALQNETRDDYGPLARILYPHHEVHGGSTYQVSYKSPDANPIADDGTIEILIRCAAKEAHCTFEIAGGGDTEVVLIENPTVTDAGTGLTEHNMKRRSTKTATVTAFHTPTTAGGTTLHNSFEPGGVKNFASGGTARQSSEWMFEPNEDYLIRGINRAGNAQPMSIVVQWYEETV